MDFTQYRYDFVGYGFVASGQRNDHSMPKSTSELFQGSMHLLPKKIDTFITRRQPNFDGLLGVWLKIRETQQYSACADIKQEAKKL